MLGRRHVSQVPALYFTAGLNLYDAIISLSAVDIKASGPTHLAQARGHHKVNEQCLRTACSCLYPNLLLIPVLFHQS